MLVVGGGVIGMIVVDDIVTHRNIQVFRFSGEFVVFYELGQYDLLYTLWDHNISMKHPMGPACVEFIPGSSEKQIPS